MSTRNTLLAACSALVVGCGAALAESPNLGKAASPEEIASWDISIGPDGAGLPSGSGTPQQGEQVYLAKCLACHGEKGSGKPSDQLVGGQGSLGPGQAPVKTVGSFWPYATTVFDYVRRAMPLNESKSPAAQRRDRRERYDRRTDAACGANAESRWICPFFPREMILISQ